LFRERSWVRYEARLVFVLFYICSGESCIIERPCAQWCRAHITGYPNP
jgi:hypothetical protein